MFSGWQFLYTNCIDVGKGKRAIQKIDQSERIYLPVILLYFGLFLRKNRCGLGSRGRSKKQVNKKFFFQQKILIFVLLRYFSNQFQSNHPMKKIPGKNNTITHYKLLIQ